MKRLEILTYFLLGVYNEHRLINNLKKNQRLIDKNEDVIKNVKEIKEIVQILWLLSSLVTACKEAGTNVYIHCKKRTNK